MNVTGVVDVRIANYGFFNTSFEKVIIKFRSGLESNIDKRKYWCRRRLLFTNDVTSHKFNRPKLDLINFITKLLLYLSLFPFIIVFFSFLSFIDISLNIPWKYNPGMISFSIIQSQSTPRKSLIPASSNLSNTNLYFQPAMKKAKLQEEPVHHFLAKDDHPPHRARQVCLRVLRRGILHVCFITWSSLWNLAQVAHYASHSCFTWIILGY